LKADNSSDFAALDGLPTRPTCSRRRESADGRVAIPSHIDVASPSIPRFGKLIDIGSGSAESFLLRDSLLRSADRRKKFMPPEIKIAVYAGQFDPVTNGHFDLIRRSARMFDRVVVGVTDNPAKRSVFEVEERVAMIADLVEHLPSVSAQGFEGLTVNFARSVGARYIIRGMRATSDFSYELQMGMMNRQLAPDIETVFIVPAAEFSFVSSTLVKDVIRLGGSITGLVPPQVERRLQERLAPVQGG
jgi:pantetheine-phosphate adenylyltransferase